VASAAEFSLSQIWVISGTFGNDLNTIEAGWQVHSFTLPIRVCSDFRVPCKNVAEITGFEKLMCEDILN
jgi:hypothetical protein